MPKRSRRDVDNSPSQGDAEDDCGLLILQGFGTLNWGKRRRARH